MRREGGRKVERSRHISREKKRSLDRAIIKQEKKEKCYHRRTRKRRDQDSEKKKIILHLEGKGKKKRKIFAPAEPKGEKKSLAVRVHDPFPKEEGEITAHKKRKTREGKGPLVRQCVNEKKSSIFSPTGEKKTVLLVSHSGVWKEKMVKNISGKKERKKGKKMNACL